MRCGTSSFFGTQATPNPSSCPGLPLEGRSGPGAERCLFSSVLALGALFGLMASPCARVPFVSAFVVAGVPLLTLLVAAPSRLGMFRELAMMVRDAQSWMLSTLCMAVGRRREARVVIDSHRADVERAYRSNPRLSALVDADPLRLHHARRLGMFATVLAVIAGVGLPFIAGETYTFGDFPQAPFVFLTDLVIIGLAARLVTERMTVRLFEASAALSSVANTGPWGTRARVVPLTTMLGAALGAVGGLVVLSAAAGASALESVAVFDADFGRAAFWFLRSTAPLALPLGIGIGAILGAGLGLSQPARRN